MSSRKKIVLTTLGVLIILLAATALYVLREIGSRYSDPESAEKYGKYANYDLHTLQFVSPKVLQSFPERTTGGKGGFARFFKRSPHAPEADLPKITLTKADFPATPSSYALYWLGHSSAILELDGQRILIDPVLQNSAPFPGISRRYTASPLSRRELPEVDVVLITHDHYDHLEARTIRFLKNKAIRFIVPLGVGSRLKGWGVPEDQITEVAWGDSVTISSLQITALPAVHYSGRSRTDRNKTLWAAYAIKGDEKNIFWSGDSGYGEHYKSIGEKYGPFDLACLEIDGWNPGWPNTHLFPEEVIRVCQDVGADLLLPIHWGVFDLALHPWNESIRQVHALASENDIAVLTPLMGERVVPGETQTRQWY